MTALFIAGCAASSGTTIRPVPQVDLQRFMGDWYVIGNIPTRPERNAYNAVESYALQPDGKIARASVFAKAPSMASSRP